ncbi:MAG: SDR family oxidoreductase [Acidobacteriota bacterium]|nr:SDR family oxidoreductase [Acidobacteriota bacterium]
MDLGLGDKIAIVTGSSRGLGLASARALVAEGCRVCICARGEERLAEAALEVEAVAKKPGLVAAVQADVSTEAGVQLLIERTVETFGGLDILVNNVGKAVGTDILATTDAEWQAALDDTLFPAIRASRAAIPHIKARGGGVILMIASIWGRESGGRMTYNAVKAAEISLAKAMAQQLAPINIRVNSVAPGSILFPGGSWHKRQQSDPQFIADMIKRDLPFGRLGRADEVGNVVAFLASSKASWVSGASVTVDGCQSRSNI